MAVCGQTVTSGSGRGRHEPTTSTRPFNSAINSASPPERAVQTRRKEVAERTKMPASGAQPAGFSLAPPRKRAPSMASHRSKMSQGGQSTYSTASVRDKDRDVRGPSIDSAGDSDDGDTVLFRADAELPPVLDAIPPARPITMGFLQPISHGADADSEEGSDDESDSEEDALLQPEVPGWAHETIGRLDISEAGESTLKPAAEPPWVAHAPPRSDSRESPPSSPPPSEAPTPPPKFAPSVSTEVTDHVSAGSTVAEPTARHQPSSLSLSSMTSYEPPSPSRASPSRSDLAPTPQTSKRALLSSIQSAASKGLKIAKEKSTELGMAAREYAIQTVEAAQEQWERQREKRLAAGPDAETASMRSGSSSWFKSTPTTVFNVLLTQSCRHFGLPFPAPATLPALIVRCLQVLDRPSVLRDSVGLYRLSASRKDLDRVRAQIESDPRCDVDFGWPNEDEPEIQAEEGVEWSTISLHAQRLEINIVAGILKLFLREGKLI